MTGASGLQVAFLFLAVQFFAMLLARHAALWLDLAGRSSELLGQSISLSLAALMLFGIPALRRQCLDALARTPREATSAEVLLVALGKCAIPFAVVGAVAAWGLVAGAAGDIARPLRAVDPVEAWTWTLSPPGLARMLVLSWIAGPIVEELVFRGLLYRAWERQFGWATSMVLTSACFGLAHPTHMASAFLGSVVYVCVLRRTGSLRAPIQVHILFNVMMSWPLLGQALFAAPAGDGARASTWALPLACLAFVSIALPGYLWMARRDVRAEGATAPPAG